ncbi:MAG: carbohydrate ABC transporter permease [Ruminococcaceae bacterium]|nr:carbohydrate ABC transporter permease [Oscillospiraceae bacterium]
MSTSNSLLASPSKQHMKRRAKAVLAFIFKVGLGLVILFPVFVMASWSLRPDAELVQYGATLFPKTWTLEYYKWAFENLNLIRYIMNSFIQFFIIFAGHVILSSLAAYAFVFFKFKGAALIFTMILVAQVIPGEVTVIANYITIQKLGLIDTFAGLTLPSLVSGMSIFMLRQYFLTIPKELKEASELDGCGDVRFLLKILLPISVPTYASLAIYDFIGVYNSWFWPLLVTNSDDMRTVQIGLAQAMGGQVYDEYGRVLAAATVAVIPTIVVFVIGQEYLIRGMVSGSVKG